ncbi:MOSC domain-containing protein [Rubellimicrobium sp. CFH 75288]|uniref:MOSC domain-containing protein n=1 Tax=Rubellimicrobium sp. CFH 75288 TaxID=2697034 RepID=UPI001411C91D|nr:hypothetical protein [Rubellimicrobium sp. CFH 75288]NAZ36339.1 hypothetical protein [Rubellimicrobium sp. CFH 75288]
MPLIFAGFATEIHTGERRSACTRVRDLHPRNTPIRDVRQLSVVSEEEMPAVARVLWPAAMDHAWLGASVAVSGIPDSTHLPPSSHLQAEEGCTLIADIENLPCHEPARTISAERCACSSQLGVAGSRTRRRPERKVPICVRSFRRRGRNAAETCRNRRSGRVRPPLRKARRGGEP